MENKHPKFLIGAFIFNDKGELFLRTTPSQDNRYTCINGQIKWGKTIEETIRENVTKKTNLSVESFELISLTDGLNITSSDNTELINMVFADYKVVVKDESQFKPDNNRENKWLLPKDWLLMDKNVFGQYIYEIIEKLA